MSGLDDKRFEAATQEFIERLLAAQSANTQTREKMVANECSDLNYLGVVYERFSPEQVAEIAVAALLQITESYGQVCAMYEICTHRACTSSYSCWATANMALAEIFDEPRGEE